MQNPHQSSEISSRRKNFIIFFIVLVGLIFLARLFYIQIVDHRYKIFASSNIQRIITDYAARGLIYDRNGDLLVFNEPYYDLMVVPGQVRQMDTLEFITLLGITHEQFVNRLQSARVYSRFRASVFERQISKNTYAVLQEKLFKYPGFYVQPRTLRKYPHPVAAHTFGYVGEAGPADIAREPYYRPGDYIGISGIERHYEEVLRGQKGTRIILVDALNRDIGSFQDGRYDTLAVAGTDLYASLDLELQLYGEKLMKNKRGSIVAIEPSTGEILALVSSPGYDPNLLVGRVRSQNYRMLQNDTLKPLFNRALMASYPPGSVFKVANFLIGLQEGGINLNSRYSCPGFYRSGGITVRCRSHPQPVNVVTGLQYSCNTFSCIQFRNTIELPKFGSMQQALTTWRDHIVSMGFGVTFNSDLSHELPGQIGSADYYDRIYGPRGWRALTVISLAIGQGEIGTTPMQLANLAATVANRGYYYTPHVVKAIGHPDNLNPEFLTRNVTTIDSAHFEVMAQAMFETIESGTGRFSRMPDITMAGKTGTVQNPHGENHSAFIAFAPVDHPTIAISVIVENAGGGATWAAPITSLMIEKYINREIKRTWFEQRILDAAF
ncbi:MAG: penicillin-binding protein 2 [Bacteroidetes bacterium]|nr:MAG: penicillin-binding protein 2 [Bacteroidota bacterium]